MDAATFVVSLVNNVTGPAHAASKSIDDLNKRMKKTGTIGFSYNGKGPTPDVVKRMNADAVKTFAKAKIGVPLMAGVNNVFNSATDGLVRYAKYGVMAIGAAGAALGAFAVKSTVHMAAFAESTRLAFGLLTGNRSVGDKTFLRTVELSKQLGMGVEDAAHSMQKLLAMQMNPAEAEKWIKLGADLRAVGVSEPALQRVMLDIAHVKATGKLNMRNVNMFANAGVSAQLLMEEVGKAMGTDEAGAMAAMHKGKITSAIALPALERAIMRKTHSHAPGEAGAAFANSTLTGLFGRLKNAPDLFGLKIAEKIEGSSGAIGKLKGLVDSLLGAIDKIDGDTVVSFVENALSFMTKLVPLTLSFAKGFGEGFGEMNAALGQLDPSKASLETAKDMGHALADGFKMALEVMKKLMETILWLDQHRNVAVGIAGMLAIDRIGGVGTTAGGLVGAGKGLYRGGKALSQGAGLAEAGKAALGLGSAAAGTASTATALGVSGAALGAGAIGLAGLVGAGAIIAYREEIAKWMFSERNDDPARRGLGPATPTQALANLQNANGRAPTTNNVRFESSINIDGANHDPNEIARNVSDQQRGMMEQFFQSQALEQGAAG